MYMAGGTWLTARTRAAAIVIPVVLLVELLAFGANGAVLAIAAANAQIVGAIAVLMLSKPDKLFWRGAWPVLLWLGAILVWVSLPEIAPGLLPDPTQRVAPDLWKSGFTRLLGTIAVLMAGGWVGYRRGLMREAVDWLLIAGIGQMAVALFLRQADPEHVWGYGKGILTGRFTGTFLNANASGCLFAVIAVLAVGRWLAGAREASPVGGDWKRITFQAACAVAALAALGAIGLTGSRTSLVLALLALLLLVAFDSTVRRALRKPAGKAVAAAIILAIIVGLALGADVTLSRFDSLGADSIGRTKIWSHYAGLVGRAPIFGYGLQAFSELNDRTLRGAGGALSFWYINSAHNAALALLLEGGWPYLALVVGLLVTIVVTVARQQRSGRDEPLLRATLAALMVMLGCAMVDIVFDVPALTTLATFLIACAWGRAIRIGADRYAPSLPSSARKAFHDA